MGLAPSRLKLVIIVLLAIAGITASISSKAQTGNYFLSHYAPEDERLDNTTFDMAQDDKGIIYFANKSGILAFDGRNWTLIPAPGPVYTLTTLGEDVYAGGSMGFGKIVWGSETAQVYESLSADQPEAQHILFSLSIKDKIYFLSEQALYIFSTATGKTEAVIKSPTAGISFTGLYEVIGNVILGTDHNGLFKIDAGKLVPSKFTLPDGLTVTFCTPLKESNKILVGSDSSRLFIFDADRGLKEVRIQDKTFLDNNEMVDGVWVNADLIAIGTLRRGVIFINPQTGITMGITNFHTGLPDNEVFSMLADRNQGIWVAHEYGFTRIAPYLPFRSYNHYPGLAGNLLCAYGFKGQLYVGTTLGLFVLVREELYEEEVSFTPVSAKKQVDKGTKGKKGGILSFLKKEKTSKTNPKNQGKKTTKKVLKSIQYAFKKVEGAEGKVSQLMIANNKLLAGGISGVSEVQGEKATTVLREPARAIFLASSLNQLLVSTFADEVKTFSFEGKDGWRETHLLDTLHEDINYIFEDKLQNVWLCGKAGVYRVEAVDQEITEVVNVPFNNPFVDEPVGVAWGTEVYLAASGYFNKLDPAQDKFTPFNNNKLPAAKKYFASAGYFWFYDGHRWRNVDENLQKALKLEWLGLFPNIRYLAPTGSQEGLWVITGANELYNFSINKAALEQNKYPLFLREVRGQQSKIAPSRSLVINQLESSVVFEFIQPDFLGMKAIEYRHRVTGLTKEWSPWSSTNNVVNFSYLPIGKYKVEVQTHDLMSNATESEQIDQAAEIDLEVEPPYWKTSWFYAAEFGFFTILVFISLRLGSANSKYRYISRLLSLLTVIMLIQFIQTVVESQISLKSTPVIEFFVQVFIALLVLPIEGYLRKFMLRSAEGAALPSRLWDDSKNLKRKAG